MRTWLLTICILDNGSFESLLKHILDNFKNNLSQFFVFVFKSQYFKNILISRYFSKQRKHNLYLIINDII
jgi:hypothetical protein